MKKAIRFQKMLFVAILSLMAVSCDLNSDEQAIPITPNIVETAQATAALSSLVTALAEADEKAGTNLIATLSGNGPFTVFAPTNDAFTALFAELEGFDSLNDFDTDEEKALLATILTYHVVSGTAARSTDLSEGQKLTTVQGEELTVSLEGGVYVQDPTETDAEVILANVEASNGIVHVIDKVLAPQEVLDALNASTAMQNIVEIAIATEDLSLLVGALQQADAGLVDALGGNGPFTVFAPTNAAFAALLETLGDEYSSLDDFDTEDEKALLAKILTYHVVAAQAESNTLSNGQMIPTLQGEEVTVVLEGGVFIKDKQGTEVQAAQVVTADIMANNGIVHVIDNVLLPQEVLTALGY